MLQISRFLTITFVFVFLSCTSDDKETPDVIAPVLEFNISGATNTTTNTPMLVSNLIEVTINANDAGGIRKIEAFINDDKVGEDSTAPYNISIDISTYASKKGTSNKYKDYTLKIVATDLSGNSTTKQIPINIDNEKPSITEVSLVENTINNGDENIVTFKISDNQELNSVIVYINDEVLSTIENENYEVNIETSNLDDGENSLKIEALDNAENLTIYTVKFIVDNSGPTITLTELVENQIIDYPTSFTPEINDTYSEIDSVKIYYNDVLVQSFENQTQYEFDFNSDNYNTADGILKISAKDNLGNTSLFEIPIQIYRRLLKITIPSNFKNPQSARFYVFASGLDGTLLDTKQVYNESNEIILNTAVDIDVDTAFMITFSEYISGQYGNSSAFTSILNLKRGGLESINLKTPNRFDSEVSNSYSVTGFNPDDILSMPIEGFGYSGDYSKENSEISIRTQNNITNNIDSEYIYLPVRNLTNYDDSYILLEKNEITSDFVLNPSLLTNQGIETRFYSGEFSNNSDDKLSVLKLWGYANEQEYNDRASHRLYAGGSTITQEFNPENGLSYPFNSTFYNYRHQVQIEDYYTDRIGEPLDFYQVPGWTIDQTLSNKTINIVKSGTGHKVGRIRLDNSTSVAVINGINVTYQWNLIFDSENTTTITLPELPEDIQTWGFNQLYEANALNVSQIEIMSFEGIPSYDTYLNETVKEGRKFINVSNTMDTKFKNYNSTYYSEFPDLFFYYY